jgi:hypothetical protein
MLTPIGDIEVDLSQVYGATDVQENPPEEGGETTYAFEIALHGGSIGLVGDSREDAEEAREAALAELPEGSTVSTGGVTFDLRRVTAVGPVAEDDEEGAIGFEVYFPGSQAALLYADEAAAEAARDELIAAIDGAG